MVDKESKTKKGIKAGTVFIGISLEEKTLSKKTVIKGSRDQVRKKASSILIDLLYKNIATKWDSSLL